MSEKNIDFIEDEDIMEEMTAFMDMFDDDEDIFLDILQPTELMLGDWVVVDYKNEKRYQTQVKGIMDYGIVDSDGNIVHVGDNVRLLPISFTKEFFLLNKFENERNEDKRFSKLYKPFDIEVVPFQRYAEINIAKYCYNPEDVTECEFGEEIVFDMQIYIHNLQHLLRMYNMVDEANSLKVPAQSPTE